MIHDPINHIEKSNLSMIVFDDKFAWNNHFAGKFWKMNEKNDSVHINKIPFQKIEIFIHRIIIHRKISFLD